MKNFNCSKCGSTDLFIKTNDTQVGLYCTDCGKWIKWLGKDEKRLAENWIEYVKNETEKQTPINTSSKANAEETSKLEKLLSFVTNEENKYYDLAFESMRENNMQGNLMCIAQASSFQRVRYVIENMLEVM